METVRKNRHESPVWYNSPNINVFRFISSLYNDICIVPGPGISVGRLVRLVFMPLFQPLFFVRYLYVVSSLNINAKREKWTFCLGQNANRIVSNFFTLRALFSEKLHGFLLLANTREHPSSRSFFCLNEMGKARTRNSHYVLFFWEGKRLAGGGGGGCAGETTWSHFSPECPVSGRENWTLRLETYWSK